MVNQKGPIQRLGGHSLKEEEHRRKKSLHNFHEMDTGREKSGRGRKKRTLKQQETFSTSGPRPHRVESWYIVAKRRKETHRKVPRSDKREKRKRASRCTLMLEAGEDRGRGGEFELKGGKRGN